MKAIPAFAATALLMLAIGPLPASSAGDTATASRTANVSIVNFAFRPGALAVGKGTKVVFSNTSNTAHTATRAAGFDTGRIKPGRSASVTFRQRGTFRYHCKIHPEMRGKVVVG
jgi:plastocyanin